LALLGPRGPGPRSGPPGPGPKAPDWLLGGWRGHSARALRARAETGPKVGTPKCRNSQSGASGALRARAGLGGLGPPGPGKGPFGARRAPKVVLLGPRTPEVSHGAACFGAPERQGGKRPKYWPEGPKAPCCKAQNPGLRPGGPEKEPKRPEKAQNPAKRAPRPGNQSVRKRRGPRAGPKRAENHPKTGQKEGRKQGPRAPCCKAEKQVSWPGGPGNRPEGPQKRPENRANTGPAGPGQEAQKSPIRAGQSLYLGPQGAGNRPRGVIRDFGPGWGGRPQTPPGLR